MKKLAFVSGTAAVVWFASPFVVTVASTTNPEFNEAPCQKQGKKAPYHINGVRYTPLKTAKGYSSVGEASWYGPGFHGRKTANGEIFNMHTLTAAHKTLPIPSNVKVCNLENHKCVVVRVNDRGPYHGDRIIDVSAHVAELLEFKHKGVAKVQVDVLPFSCQA